MLKGHSLGDISPKMAKSRLLVFWSSLLPGAGIFWQHEALFGCFNSKSDF